MMKFSRRKLCISLCVILLISALSVGVVYAIDSFSGNSGILVTDAIKASDVCEAHLVQNCTECNGNEISASYARYCPICNKRMTLCCSGLVAEDDHRAKCYVYDHPSECENIQDLYWNGYVCVDCKQFQTGSKSDDIHVEAYWHTKVDGCYDHSYCSMPRASDLLSSGNKDASSNISSHKEKGSASHEYASEYEAALAAGDICEVCGKLACKTLHEDK